MTIDWIIFSQIAGPIFAAALGAVAHWWFTRGPRLVVYFGHTSAFTIGWDHDNSATPTTIHTHTLIIRNIGRAAANNVRVGHNVWPNYFDVQLPTQHRVEDVPNSNTKEIVINKMVSCDEVHISYIYFPPLTWQQIHTSVKSDEGQATGWRVALQRVFPRWFNVQATVFYLIGIVAAIYVIVIAVI